MKLIGVVKNLWRYPVKSMIGERCGSLVFEERGVVGDRLFAVKDEQGKFGSGKNTRRFVKIDGLFKFRAVYEGSVPLITFPDGRSVRGDDASIHAELTEALNQRVTLAQEEQHVSHFDNAPVHLVTTASLDWLSAKLPDAVVAENRFRPNVVIEAEDSGLVEQNWLGKRLRIGDVLLEITRPTERCQMTNFAQPAIPEDRRIFACIGREADLHFGVYAKVLVGGEVAAGDKVAIV